MCVGRTIALWPRADIWLLFNFNFCLLHFVFFVLFFFLLNFVNFVFLFILFSLCFHFNHFHFLIFVNHKPGSLFRTFETQEGEEGHFSPRQKNCYKSCLLHPNHLKLGATHIWTSTKFLILVTWSEWWRQHYF